MKPKPEWCSWCGVSNPGDEHWKWEKDKRYKHGGKWRCRERAREQGRKYLARRRADPIRKAEMQEAAKRYHLENPEYARYKAYRSADKRKGHTGPLIPWDEARPLMLADCSYCGGPGGGLDRINNEIGHVSGNCVPACATCNLLLLDMPEGMKKLFSYGLRSAREEGYFELWQHPRMRA